MLRPLLLVLLSWQVAYRYNRACYAFSTRTLTSRNQQCSSRHGESSSLHFTLPDFSPELDRSLGNSTETTDLTVLQQKALAIREEADRLQAELEVRKQAQIEKQTSNIDRWIEDLLVACNVDETTQLINSVDQVFEVLRDRRYSQEQVMKIFNRILETSGQRESRSKCSELLSTFVDACGKLDCLDSDDNPNKRWSGKVERLLRKRLFARDWGMDIFEDEDDFFL